jgi:NAD(P)-dependent dehydrogenase (short-subunit alcohol dehydrogenase family)
MSAVLITGANRGIGRAIAGEFARRGHRVVATARDPRSLADLDVNQRLALDVTDDASVTAAFAAAGDIDIVIANAGVIFYAAVEATPLPELQRLLNLNTIGAIRVAQAVLPQMRARGDGKLLFVSSILGRVVLPPGAAYASTKWALEALVESLAIEVAPFGVQAALLEPGTVSSGALDNVTTYTLPDDPYAAILKNGGSRDGQITPEQVAAEVADAAEQPQLPLRIPIGDAARALLAARRAAPDDVPFAPTATRA